MEEKPTVLGYIKDTTRALKYTYENRKEFEEPFVEFFKKANIKKILFFGSGTSYNVSIVSSYYVKNILGIDAEYHYPTVFENYEKADWTNTLSNDEILFVGISQSGTSISTVNLMKYAVKKGHKALALTEALGSEITKHVDSVIHMLCGKELTPPETRGYTVTVYQIYLSIIRVAYELGKMSKEEYDQKLLEAKKLADEFDTVIKESEEWFDRNATNIVNSERIYVLGYGIDFTTAIEAQLKIGEMLRLPVLGYEIEEYSHGPTMAINKKQSIFMIGSDEAEWERSLKFREAFLKYTPRVNFISCKEFDATEKDLKFSVKTSKYLAPLMYTIPFQFVSAKGALLTDIDTCVNPFKERLAHL